MGGAKNQVSKGTCPSAARLMGIPHIFRGSRLEWIGLFTIVALLVFTGLLQAEPVAGKPVLTVVSRGGGAYTKSQMLAFVKPYREMTSRWVNVEEYNGGLAQIRAQVSSLNAKWDVVEIEIADAIRACEEGLLEHIDHSVLGRSAVEDFYPEALQDCAVGETIYAMVIGYNAGQSAAEKPSGLADFFDLKRFPGARGLRNAPVVTLEWALMADGVPTDQVYQVLSTDSGVNRAFAVLDRIKEKIIWWDDPVQPLELLRNKEVVMTSAYSGGLLDAIKKRNEDLGIVWDGQVWDMLVWSIPKQAINLEDALDFIVFASDPKRMAVHANRLAYAPVRKSATALIDDSVKKYQPTARENAGNVLQVDYVWWITSKKATEIQARFARWRREETWRYDPDLQEKG